MSNPAQLLNIQSLRSINEKFKLLHEALVSKSFSAEELVQLQDSIDFCLQLTQATTHASERPLKHFDFSSAKRNPNEILPYSPVTGYYNPIAPDIDVNFDSKTQTLTATCLLGRVYEGPPGMAHGGIISAIYDQLLAMCGTCNSLAGPTANLSINYLKPTPLFETLEFFCEIIKQEGRKIYIQGHCKVDGEITSKADGLFIFYAVD